MISVWTEERIERAKTILGETPLGSLQSALERLSAEFEFPVTYDALGNAFRKRGLGALTAHCKGASPVRLVSAPSPTPKPPAASPDVQTDCCAPLVPACLVPSEPPPSPSTTRVLFVPDAHFPHEDKRAWALMLKAARGWRPHQVIVLGDLADFFTVSFHPKSPDRKANLEREIESLSEALTDLESLGAEKRVFLSGNHENRLDRYLIQHAPALYSMMRLPEILKLDERGWRWVPYMQSVKVGSAHVSHDFGDAGGNAHTKARQLVNSSAIIGHTHRMATTFQTQADGRVTVGAMFGHLLDTSSVDYLHRARTNLWQLGFGVGHIDPTGHLHLQAIPIVEYRCVLDGVLYEQPPLPRDN